MSKKIDRFLDKLEEKKMLILFVENISVNISAHFKIKV